MKKMNRLLLLLITTSSIGITSEYTVYSASSSAPRQPNFLLLTQETSFYSDPDEVESIGALSPQKVEVVHDYSHVTSTSWDNDEWIKIKTWLGDQWIKPHNALMQEVAETYLKAEIHENKTLYNQPFDDEGTDASISAQSVSVKGYYGGWYLISTWLGDKWINLKGEKLQITNSKRLFQEIKIDRKTPFYLYPDEKNAIKGYVNAQTLNTIEQSEYWYKVTISGEGEYWINPSIK